MIFSKNHHGVWECSRVFSGAKIPDAKSSGAGGSDTTPPLQVFQLAVLRDNYIYVLHDTCTQITAVVDPALAEPVQDFLQQKKWKLNYILNTHHHPDHVGGNLSLQKQWGCPVVGFSGDAHRIPGINQKLDADTEWSMGRFPCRILFVPGHTLGHIAYWFFQHHMLFCGDTLFAMGCGRLFEGSYQQMFDSLRQFKGLPGETQVYCTHEYTEKNAQFAMQFSLDHPEWKDPEWESLMKQRMEKIGAQRKAQTPTVPFLLSEDLKTNPFLRATTVQEFRQLRIQRDSF